MRDFFLWLPNGLLLVQFALTGKTAQVHAAFGDA
jgi:hypothetical protein